jgi:polysaccharide chain length determinant protein (PEP-CTERM system associated)
LKTQSLYDLFQILKRRKLGFLAPFGLMVMTGIFLVMFLPSYYKSTATILVEEQKIPQNFVMAAVTSYAEQRLQMINSKIMGFSNLQDLIKRFNLYEKLKSKNTSEQIVQKMRDNIKLEMIRSDNIDPKTGRPSNDVVAFTLSYEGTDPQKVYHTITELSSQYLKQNMATRKRQSGDTSSFIESELNKIKHDLDKTDAQINRFKQKHLLELPDSLQANIGRLTTLEQSISALRDRQMVLRQQENKLQTQLVSVSPSLELITIQKQLDELKMTLMSLKSKFSSEHPDVKKAEAEIRIIEQQLKNRKRSAISSVPDNPIYIALSSERSGIKSEIDSLSTQIVEKIRNRVDYNGRIETTSRIESEYNGLLAEQANMKNKYNDLSRKLMEAKVADGLEKEQKGEHLSLSEPASFPEQPFKPNRFLLMIISVILGIGLGSVVVFVVEGLDDSLRDSRRLIAETRLPILGNIPFIEAPRGRGK